MPLKEKCITFPERRGHAMPHREGFGQETEAGMRGKPRLESYSLKKARQGRVNSLGLASLSNYDGLWAIGMVPSWLVPGLG